MNILDNDTTPPPFPVVTITATDPVGTETVDGSDRIVFGLPQRTVFRLPSGISLHGGVAAGAAWLFAVN